MKKLLTLFLIVVSTFSFGSSFYQTMRANIDVMEKGGLTERYVLTIPDSELFSGPESWENIYPLLQKSAQQSGVNLIRTSLGYTKLDKPRIVQYLLCTDSTHFYRRFQLASGHFLTPEQTQQHSPFLSNQQTKNPSQMGVLKTFSSRPLFEIRTMRQAFNTLPLSGQYVVEASNNQKYRQFITDFSAKVNEQSLTKQIQKYNPHDFMEKNSSGLVSDFALPAYGLFGVSQIVAILAFIMTIILLIYYCYASGKWIGIMKMHGLTMIRIWYIMIGRFILCGFLIAIISSFAAAVLVPNTTTRFMLNVLINQLSLHCTILLASLVSLFYINYVRISSAVKNRRRTQTIFVLNTCFKMVSTLILIVMTISIWQNYRTLNEQYNQLQNWRHNKKSEGYGVFYPVSVDHQLIDQLNGNLSMNYAVTQRLYHLLNKKGALFINATSYNMDVLRLPQGSDSIRSIYVNPNYLKQNPIDDVKGRIVKVPEHTHDWVLLVPEKYKSREQIILNYFRAMRVTQYKVSQHQQFSVPKALRHQEVKIVWLTNNQKIFSFDPKVFPQQRNEIIDPIIQVMTEKNSVFMDNLGDINELKVKLTGKSSQRLDALRPTLRKLHLENQLEHLITVDESITYMIHTLQQQMLVYSIVFFILLVGSGLLAIQNLVLLYNKNKQKIVVRRLFGYSIIRTYRVYFLFLGVGWIIKGFISRLIINSMGSSTTNVQIGLVIVVVSMAVLEFMLTIAALLAIERRKLSELLKEGT
ncbi:MAG: hypothetical protein K0Q53_1995 [Massilibacillus sp.]|jgi:bacteriocin-associated integral membrane protein|nr:hypothetical protein [Massilibacillus sp.]